MTITALSPASSVIDTSISLGRRSAAGKLSSKCLRGKCSTPAERHRLPILRRLFLAMSSKVRPCLVATFERYHRMSPSSSLTRVGNNLYESPSLSHFLCSLRSSPASPANPSKGISILRELAPSTSASGCWSVVFARCWYSLSSTSSPPVQRSTVIASLVKVSNPVHELNHCCLGESTLVSSTHMNDVFSMKHGNLRPFSTEIDKVVTN